MSEIQIVRPSGNLSIPSFPILRYNKIVTKLRILLFLLTIIIVGSIGTFVSFYARGYRFDIQKLKFVPNGLLVAKSDPDGASIFIDGELKGATNSTLSIPPGTYDIEIKKDGFLTWRKRLEVTKELVTEADAFLFRSIPSLSPITSFGAVSPIISSDLTKIAYQISPSPNTPDDRVGLWVMDTLNLPLGFPRDPRRVTDGDLTGGIWQFSPDGRDILLTLGKSVFLLDTGSFTPQSGRVNIATQRESILASWDTQEKSRQENLVKNLPGELADIITRKTSNVSFSPDQTKILYTASASLTLSPNLIPPVLGASTQKQDRAIKLGSTYVYDIKEDRNFLITQQTLTPTTGLFWFPTSRHLILAEDNRVTIMDYDGTNRQVVYSGNYVAPYAYPYLTTTKLLILTNLGASSSVPNLYSLSLK